MASSGLPGRPTGIPCPKKDCPGEVVYNGNYFCSLWEHPYVGNPLTCNWALSHDEKGKPIGARDKRVWKQIEQSDFYINAMKGRS
jgi:hypothetical protein